MHILSIDVGSYSVKYISSFIERKKITHVEMSEIIILDYLSSHPEQSLHETQATIVSEIIDTVAKPDSKIIFQADHDMMTTRFINLPVKNKKKAELMLPFQLEEDIPHSLSEIHYGFKLDLIKNKYVALAELTKLSTFENYFQTFKEKKALPNILTTESSILDTYFFQVPVAGPFCILDMGHRTTKCYLFYNSKLLATHISFIGGQQINEMIAETYQIGIDEAVIYKHQNAFVLTQSQYDEVNVAQKDFSKAIDHLLSPLISDFIRWKIGFKVNFGLSLNNVYLCGGTSNIKNISNYLSEKWDLKVSPLDTFDKVETSKIDLNPKNSFKYALVNMMVCGFRKKNHFINLLSGKFAQISSAEIPLNSLAYISVRVGIVSLLIILTLLAERFIIEKDIKFVNSKITTLMKNQSLDISGRIKRAMLNDPKPLLSELVKKQRSVRQEVSTFQSSLSVDCLTFLVQIGKIAFNTKVILTQFYSNEFGDIKATFSSDNLEDLEKLKENVSHSELNYLNATLDKNKLTLNLNTGK